MSSELKYLVEKIVIVLTNDGSIYVGLLRGFDQLTNIILSNSHERVYQPDGPVELIARGLYMIRGDNVAMIGELDEEIDSQLDFDTIRGDTIPPIKH